MSTVSNIQCKTTTGIVTMILSSLSTKNKVYITDVSSGIFDIPTIKQQNNLPSDTIIECFSYNSGNKKNTTTFTITDIFNKTYVMDSSGSIVVPQLNTIKGFSLIDTPTPTSDSSSGTNILSIICCILILVGIGYGAYYYYTTNLDSKVTKKVSGGFFDVGE
jgi:hypothetical protein